MAKESKDGKSPQKLSQKNPFAITYANNLFSNLNRYEIIDSDPDPPTPPQPYRASVNALVPVPKTNEGLSELPPRRTVLAVYPFTTTFYKAEVVASRPGKGLKKDGKDIGADLKEGYVRLRFEGEDEADTEKDVERRYVLPEPGR